METRFATCIVCEKQKLWEFTSDVDKDLIICDTCKYTIGTYICFKPIVENGIEYMCKEYFEATKDEYAKRHGDDPNYEEEIPPSICARCTVRNLTYFRKILKLEKIV